MSVIDRMGLGGKIDEVTEDEDVRQWLQFGRLAMFFCIWSAMAIPVLLIIAVR